ncbi:MAG TPA: sugar ABC transporter permease [Rectinemataceae bacterium]|nr:sugar ABC transporter permease [Rectinemataceae bacterium]
MRRNKILPYLLVAPTLLFVTAFTLLPLGEVLVGSLFKHKLNIPRFQHPVFVGGGNFVSLFHDPDFLQVLANTGIYVAILIPLLLVASLGLAFLLEGKMRGIGFFRLAAFHPTILPMVSAATIWMFLLTPGYGLWNQALHLFGYDGPQNWIGNPGLALFSLILTAFWKNVGYLMLFFLSGLQNIDRSVVEAARLDGAGGLRLVRKVILPLIRRQTLFVTTVAFIGAFQTVDHVFVLTQGGPSETSALLLYYLWQMRFERLDIGGSNAVTVIIILVLLTFTVSNFLVSERNEK